MTLQLTYDQEADTVHVRLSEAVVYRVDEIDRCRRIDYDSQGNPVGVEFLSAGAGVELTGLPQPERIAVVLSRCNFEICGPRQTYGLTETPEGEPALPYRGLSFLSEEESARNLRPLTGSRREAKAHAARRIRSSCTPAV